MNAILVLIPISLVLMGFAVGLFFWAVRHGQFRNLETPAILPLLDAREAAADDDAPAATDAGPHSRKEVSP